METEIKNDDKLTRHSFISRRLLHYFQFGLSAGS
jgi:hypothetical protein